MNRQRPILNSEDILEESLTSDVGEENTDESTTSDEYDIGNDRMNQDPNEEIPGARYEDADESPTSDDDKDEEVEDLREFGDSESTRSDAGELDGEEDGEGEAEEADDKSGDDADADADADVPKGVQKRLNKMARKVGDAERRAADLETERNEWRQLAHETAKTQDAKVETPASVDEPEPQSSDYEDYDQWVADLVAWNTKKVTAQVTSDLDAKEKKQAESRRMSEKAIHLSTAQDNARKRYADYNEVAGKARLTDPMIDASLDSPYVAELGYYFGKHPDDQERIAQLTNPIAVAREIGKLEVKIEAGMKKNTAPKPRTTNTPAPVNTVGGSSGTPGNIDPGKMTVPQFRKWREKMQKLKEE